MRARHAVSSRLALGGLLQEKIADELGTTLAAACDVPRVGQATLAKSTRSYAARVNDLTVRQKVVCYVVRGDELLVFRHLDEPWDESGLQVPAGSVEPGESPEEAALREANEETGLHSLRLVRKLGETDYDMSPSRNEVQHRHVFHLSTDEETPPRWASYEEDPDDGSGVIRFECFWIPLTRGHVLSGGQGALLGRL
jgi:8-oxo-dGTP pyrophosphatase MutT (NUDIX family)